MNRGNLKQAVFWIMAADAPVLYVGAVTIESTATVIAALVVAGIAAAIAAVVY